MKSELRFYWDPDFRPRMPLHYIGKVPGFAQRTFTEVEPTKFLQCYNTGKWRSPVTQGLIKADLMEFENYSSPPTSYSFKLAVDRATHAFHLPTRVPMIHLNDVFQKDLDIWTKSPGLPWIHEGYKTKGDIKRDPEAIRRVRKYWHLVKAGHDIRPPDCLAYVRSHVCDIGDSKIRAVWGYPATVLFGEAVFALPLLRAYKRGGPIAYGYETALGGMKKLYDRMCLYPHFTGLDFKSFDKTVPAWLIKIAFKILRLNIDFVTYEEYGTGDAVRNLINKSEFFHRNIKYTPLLLLL